MYLWYFIKLRPLTSLKTRQTKPVQDFLEGGFLDEFGSLLPYALRVLLLSALVRRFACRAPGVCACQELPEPMGR